jgi:serine/threonine-protein kinase
MIICLEPISGAGCGAQNSDTAQQCTQCGMHLGGALEALNPTDTIDKYRIVRLIGFGGFGVVYEAVGTHNAQRVALKEAISITLLQSMRYEMDVLKTLNHPNLPNYLEVVERRGKGYLVMEFVPGQNLEDVLDKVGGPLLEGQVLGYAMQLCNALTYLHSQHSPIIHRDIKPANIRLTPEAVVKLVDFGLFKIGGKTTHSSRRGVTPLYSPIEQYGGNKTTSARSDVYSLGATLYHLLTGVEPATAIDRIAAPSDPLIPPKNLNSNISLHISDAIVVAMASGEKDRFPSAEAFKQALQGNSSAVVGMLSQKAAIYTTKKISCPVCQVSCSASEIYCQQCSAQIEVNKGCPCGKAIIPQNAIHCSYCGVRV